MVEVRKKSDERPHQPIMTSTVELEHFHRIKVFHSSWAIVEDCCLHIVLSGDRDMMENGNVSALGKGKVVVTHISFSFAFDKLASLPASLPSAAKQSKVKNKHKKARPGYVSKTSFLASLETNRGSAQVGTPQTRDWFHRRCLRSEPLLRPCSCK